MTPFGIADSLTELGSTKQIEKEKRRSKRKEMLNSQTNIVHRCK